MIRAYVLAGGLGTRMRARLGETPKVLAPVGERPFLDLQLEWLAEGGVDEVVLALGTGADQVIDRLRGRDPSAHPRVTWSVEPMPLGTAGALGQAARGESRPFLVINGDTLAEIDLPSLLALREQERALVAIACHRVPDASARGRVEMADDGRVLAFREKSGGGEAWVSGGIYACDPGLVARIPAAGRSDLETDVFPALVAQGEPLYALRSPGQLFDIGTPEGLVLAARHWRARETRGRT